MVKLNHIEDDESLTKPLGRCSVFYYGVGHMLNDITSACWFTYLLVFLSDIGLSSSDAAVVMLSGQVADGLTTVFAGELDLSWLLSHFLRYLEVACLANLSVPIRPGCKLSVTVCLLQSSIWDGLLLKYRTCNVSSYLSPCAEYYKTVGHSTDLAPTRNFATLGPLQLRPPFAGASVAGSPVIRSMVNCITLNSTSRVVLSSCRNAFTMVANLSLYGVAFVVFNVVGAGTPAAVENQYRWIAYISIFIGSCFVIVFAFGIREPRLKLEAHVKGYVRISWMYWFKKILYHQVALVYVLTRLVTNVSQAFLAFYVINDLGMSLSSKALVPAIIFVCSFIVSVLLQEIKWTSQRLKGFYTAGGLLWILCGTGMLLLPRNMNAFMYILSVFIGIANALIMVTGVGMQSVLVGRDLNGCAFVYGSLSFLDKMICGVALFILESYQKAPGSSPGLHNSSLRHSFCSLNRYALGLVPAVCALLGVIVTCSMNLQTPTLVPLEEPLLG